MLLLSPRSSEGTFRAACAQPSDNLAPHADPRLASPVTNRGSCLGVALTGGSFVSEEFPPLERPASPLVGDDLQAAKRGKVNHVDGALTGDGGMEIDDQQVTGDGVSLESDSAPPSRSYAGVVSGGKKQAKQKAGKDVPSGGVGGQLTRMSDLAASGDKYGPWMIAANRNRRLRKDVGKARVEGSGERRACGSHFNVLDGEGPSDEGVQPVGGDEVLSEGVLQEVQPNVLIGHGQDNVQVLSSGGGKVPQVLPHVVSNVVGDGHRSGLKMRKGKENHQLTRSVLADWLPQNFGHSGIGSSKQSEALDPHGVVAPVSSNRMENGVVNLVSESPDDGGGHCIRVSEPQQ
ncbi:hypothetical protein V6N11_004828 [Hibiscus sabdariffa]|uniref:Uncharacterized protein n=1 Tax=Hibiscus sabdariffa TaxID=183260 RepID=A0ABR2SHG8_9ROSI